MPNPGIFGPGYFCMQVIDWFGGVRSQMLAENMMELAIPMKFEKS